MLFPFVISWLTSYTQKHTRTHTHVPCDRFEMPYNVWCTHCQAHIGMGVRFNAEKQRTGAYHTTPIYSFTMTCHLCGGRIVVATDPAAGAYVLLEGARRRVEEFDPASVGLVAPMSKEERERIASSAFAKVLLGLCVGEGRVRFPSAARMWKEAGLDRDSLYTRSTRPSS
jgi:hypothetical protein